MDEESIICPSCGAVVPQGQFCKDCGVSLLSSQDVDLTEPEETILETDSEETDDVSFPAFRFRIPEMDELSHAILFSRAELTVINIELDKLIEEISATRQAAYLEQADKRHILERVKILKQKLEKTKARKSELLTFKRHLRIEEIHLAHTSYRGKLLKLKETQSSIDSEVFKEQRKEIESKLDIVDRDLKLARKTASKWLKGIKNIMKELVKQVSRIEAKHRVDDITDREYEKSRMELDRSLETLTYGTQIIEEILVKSQ